MFVAKIIFTIFTSSILRALKTIFHKYLLDELRNNENQCYQP